MANTILITGASTGIGRATALEFVRRGWNVAATMRNPEQLSGFISHPRLRLIALDVTQEASIKSALASVREAFGAVDVLVNNAGYGMFGAFEAVTDGQVRAQFETNVFGLMTVMRHVLPDMRERRKGLIINVSSIGGRIGFPMSSLYHASKFAVEGLTESIRFELQPFGMRLKLIEPGGIRTDFVHRSLVFAQHAAYARQEQNYRKILNDDRLFAKPEQVAQVIYRAATDGSNRLRYPAKPGPFLVLRALLPDQIWRGLMNRLLHRKQVPAAPPA